MTGLENISATNGWAMAATGAFIVFVGLVALAFVISQLHKLLSFFEGHYRFIKKSFAPAEVSLRKSPPTAPPSVLTVAELKLIYRPLAEQLGDWFELSDLYRLSRKMDLPHPHLSIRQLREARILLPNDKGQFFWSQP